MYYCISYEGYYKNFVIRIWIRGLECCNLDSVRLKCKEYALWYVTHLIETQAQQSSDMIAKTSKAAFPNCVRATTVRRMLS
jgi:hypothetical protein